MEIYFTIWNVQSFRGSRSRCSDVKSSKIDKRTASMIEWLLVSLLDRCWRICSGKLRRKNTNHRIYALVALKMLIGTFCCYPLSKVNKQLALLGFPSLQVFGPLNVKCSSKLPQVTQRMVKDTMDGQGCNGWLRIPSSCTLHWTMFEEFNRFKPNLWTFLCVILGSFFGSEGV